MHIDPGQVAAAQQVDRLPVVQFTQARFVDDAEAIERKLGTVLQCDIDHSRNEQVQAFELRNEILGARGFGLVRVEELDGAL